MPNNLIGRDVVLLQSACPRPIRYILDESVYRAEPLNRFLRSRSSITMPSVRTEEAICEAANRIRKGEVVCIVPEVRLGGSKTPIQLCKEHERIAKLSENPVVPVWLDRASTSSFSSKRQQLPVRGSNRFSAPTGIAFGRPISKDEFHIALARERLLELGEFCLENRPSLEEHLGRAAIRGLRRNQFHEAIIDGIDHRRIKGGALLAASIAVSRRIKSHPYKGVAVVLSPGIGAVVANVAITLAGKTPVNLKVTAGRMALQAAIQQGDIHLAISAGMVIERLPEFPWPEEVCRMEKLVSELRARIAPWRIAVLLMPAWLISSLLHLPKKGGREEVH